MRHLIILVCIALISCDDKSTESSNTENKNPSISNVGKDNLSKQDETISRKKSHIEYSEIDFLTVCDSLEMWFGGIQGGKTYTESCCYVMAQCESNYHFDLVMYHPSRSEIKKYINGKTISSNIPNSTFFAFEIQKTKPTNPENEFETFDYVFPSIVTVFQKKDSKWKFIHESLVQNFDELGELKNKIISGYNKAYSSSSTATLKRKPAKP